LDVLAIAWLCKEMSKTGFLLPGEILPNREIKNKIK
jgi:hypothetical protein